MQAEMLATIVIGRSDLEELLNMSEVNVTIEEAFRSYGQGLWDNPTKIIFPQEKYNGDFGAVPAYCHEPEFIAIKWGGVHNDNPKIGLPVSLNQIILSDPKTAYPLMLADGALITQMRTGAALGIATKYMANANASTLAVVGAGAIGRKAAESICLIKQIKQIRVASLALSEAEKYAADMEAKLGVEILPVKSIEEAVSNADIISVATPSHSPIIKADWIKPGTHINAMGADSPGKQELDPAILAKAHIIVDHKGQALVYGEVHKPIQAKILEPSIIKGDIGEVVVGKVVGRNNFQEITVFDGTGIALEDAAVAYMVYNKAKSMKDRQFQEISLW